jgi:hypothetical protein
MRKFSFDMPSRTTSVTSGLALYETKVLRIHGCPGVSLRDVLSISFASEMTDFPFRNKPTGMVKVVIQPNVSQKCDPMYILSLRPVEAQELYQKLFDEFFADACLTEVQRSTSAGSFPLRWSEDLDWQPFQVEREVKETVEKNW